MGEKSSHKRAKQEAAGTTGRTEFPIKGQRRLDAATKYKAVEVEQGGPAQLKKAARRLKDSGKRQRVLIVPSRNMDNAREAMRAEQVSGTVRNISGTRRSSVRKKK